MSRCAHGAESRYGWIPRRAVLALSVVSLTVAISPAVAGAHGPVAPIATSYLARVSSVPPALDAKVIDGYVRMWLHVPPDQTVTVLDYRGAPYLRFSSAGVEVNHNSSMYYLNQTPVAATPPGDLSADTPPSWQLVSGGHAYEWHDGRLQALATVALASGTTYVGRWSIPVLVNGRRASLEGGLWHADDPSIVWFWPMVVLFACVLAAWRVASVELDARTARALALLCLLAIAAAAIARGFHGRPGISAGQYIGLVIVGAFVGWGASKVLLGGAGFFSYFVIGSVAIWEGLNVLPALLHSYVLLALPPFLTRAATVACLGGGVSIMLPMFRLAERRQDAKALTDDVFDDEVAIGER